jgi:hypothetical protein
MIKDRKAFWGFAGVLMLGIALALGISALSSHNSLAASLPQAAATPQATQTPGGSQRPNNGLAGYRDYFIQAFANQLGVTLDKLKSALLSAITETLNKAVQDGKLTQDRSTQIQQSITNWLNSGMQGFPFVGKPGMPGFGFRFGGRFGPGFFGGGNLLSSFAKALNLDLKTLMTDLRNGQTLADVAAAQTLDIQQVKQAVLADIQSQLDNAVKNNKLTQSQETQIMQNITKSIDNLINQKWNNFGPRNRFNNGTNNGPNSGTRNGSNKGFFSGSTL